MKTRFYLTYTTPHGKVYYSGDSSRGETLWSASTQYAEPIDAGEGADKILAWARDLRVGESYGLERHA